MLLKLLWVNSEQHFGLNLKRKLQQYIHPNICISIILFLTILRLISSATNVIFVVAASLQLLLLLYLDVVPPLYFWEDRKKKKKRTPQLHHHRHVMTPNIVRLDETAEAIIMAKAAVAVLCATYKRIFKNEHRKNERRNLISINILSMSIDLTLCSCVRVYVCLWAFVFFFWAKQTEP